MLGQKIRVEWAFSLCPFCLKNAHREEKVELRKLVSPKDETKFEELYVCTRCGSTRKL